MAQQCEHNLAASSWKIANSASNPRPWHGLDEWRLRRLKLIPPHPHSEILHQPLEVDSLQLVGSCFVAHQHDSLIYVECIFSVCGILCSGRRSSMQQSLENVRVAEIESESVLCYWVCFVRTEQCVCFWQQHSNNLALCCLKTMVDSYFLAYVAIWCYWQEKFVFLNK